MTHTQMMHNQRHINCCAQNDDVHDDKEHGWLSKRKARHMERKVCISVRNKMFINQKCHLSHVFLKHTEFCLHVTASLSKAVSLCLWERFSLVNFWRGSIPCFGPKSITDTQAMVVSGVWVHLAFWNQEVLREIQIWAHIRSSFSALFE